MSAHTEMLPDWVRSSNPPVKSAPPADKIKWLREFARLVANDMALAEIYGLEAPADLGGAAETLLICIGMAERIGGTREQGILAGRAEWAAAKERARGYADELRRGVWTLGRDGAAGGEIVARAEAVNRRQYWRNQIELMPADLLSVTREIAFASAGGRKARGR